MSPLTQFQKITKHAVPAFDFHMHTTWTDGAQTAVAMHNSAVEEGLTAVLFSEHARRSSEDWFFRFADEVRSLPKERCQAYVGVETKVLNFDGAVDTTDAIMRACDLVMASVHRFPGEEGIVQTVGKYSKEQAIENEFRLSMAALDNPQVDILGHPFGMSLRRFKVQPPEPKFREIVEKAARTGVAVEVNTHYHPNPWEIISWCQEYGALFSLGSNAHNTVEVGSVVRILEGRQAAWIFES